MLMRLAMLMSGLVCLSGIAERPNVLWLAAEDMGLDLSCYGAPVVRTPNLDRLAREAGFEATFSLHPGSARPEKDSPWHIRRFTITARTTVSLLAEMVDHDKVLDDGLYGARID